MEDLIIQGISYDEKSSYLLGASQAPPLIRKALQSGSMNMSAENVVRLNKLRDKDRGDFSITEYTDIEKITKQHLSEAKKVFTLGGDHSITFPIIQAFHERYPKLDILHIDAHTDLYDEFDGDPYSHACPFARIMEAKLAVRLVQVGIRTLNQHQVEQAEKFQVEMYPMKGLALPESFHFENPIYLSLDLDGLDPAFAPGVSHHEPGGLTTRQVIDIIQNLEGDIVGADIVEYNPTRDFQDTTAFVAAKLMKEILSKML